MGQRNIFVPWLCLGFLCLGCQTYDFEPVTPTTIGQSTEVAVIQAKGLKPSVMLVIDRSGSMTLPFDATNASCGTCGQTGRPRCNPATCPSRWDSLSNAAADFLTHSGTVARMGVAFFPAVTSTGIADPVSNMSTNACDSTLSIDVPLPASDADAALNASASAIQAAVGGVGSTPSPTAGGLGGGTPTGESLVNVANRAQFDPTIGRGKFLLLLTDGLPNCAAASGLNYQADIAACDCTESSASCSTYPVLSCNDYSGTAQKIAQLRTASNIQTIVVGFGDVFGPSATHSLQAMATAGGLQRRCQADGSECNPTDLACLRPSNPHLCAEQFFRATSQAQLAGALAAISASIQVGDPCVVELSPPPDDPLFISVDVTDNGVFQRYPYPSNVWSFQAAVGANPALLTFHDPLCSVMRTATDNVTYVVRNVSLVR